MAATRTADEQKALNARLLDAAETGDVPAITQALKDGADVDARNHWQNTPLHEAAKAGHNDAVKVLLEAGAEVDARNINQDIPLHWVASQYNIRAIQVLLAAGTDPTLMTRDGYTVMDEARKHNQPELANYLQSIVDNTVDRPTPKEVGLDMKKRNAALGKPVVGAHTAKAVAGMEAQRQAALNDPSEGI